MEIFLFLIVLIYSIFFQSMKFVHRLIQMSVYVMIIISLIRAFKALKDSHHIDDIILIFTNGFMELYRNKLFAFALFVSYTVSHNKLSMPFEILISIVIFGTIQLLTELACWHTLLSNDPNTRILAVIVNLICIGIFIGILHWGYPNYMCSNLTQLYPVNMLSWKIQ